MSAVAIKGLGRIGRAALKIVLTRSRSARSEPIRATQALARRKRR
jgi:hypothetical protein